MIRELLTPLLKPYVKYSLNKKGNPLEEFKEKSKNVDLPLAKKGNIFIGPIRMSIEAHLLEGLLAYYYRLNGYKVYAVMCGLKLTDCESKSLKPTSFLKCTSCFNQQKLFCQAFGVTPLYLGDFIDSKEETEIEQALENFTADEMKFRGKDLSDHVSSGIMRVLKKSKLDNSDLELVKRFGKTTLVTQVSAENMIKKYHPKHIILSHGTYSTWGGLLSAAHNMDVHSVVWGRGYVGTGNYFAAHEESYLFKNKFEPISNFKDLKLSNQEVNKLKNYFKSKRSPSKKVDYINYYHNNKKALQESDFFTQYNIPKNKPIIGMFPNIPWDGQTFSYSGLFPSIRKFIKNSIEWVKQHDVTLIIRAHPAEIHTRSEGQLETFEDILYELYPTLPSNVYFLPADSDVSSYQIEKYISTALLYAGTIGLEFSFNNTPVIQCGKNSFSNKGFIFEPNSEKELEQYLEMAKRNELKMDEQMKDLCLKYAYHWVYRRHFPETLINFEGAMEFKGYNFESADEILENEELTQFVNCIENHEDFIYRKPK